ncbi:dapper homolog 2 [Xyrichtys novacula]|uniref:Dapper homolog 2 n=1 Tax=Xyrichtys novacula TaxID=13765 RepID=A0AAV1G564_XYRNO|nr:dapper homolog 2 [Xyrichtys novacula]
MTLTPEETLTCVMLRPSAGFFELSDGSSLSNSCTSVYSECLSSSQNSLRPLSPSIVHPQQGGVCRRRSADETSTQHPPPRASGLHLGSSRIRASCTEPGRQRPVSTGDLDGILAQGLGCFKPVDPKKSSTHLRTFTMDSKFQSNLVSRDGSEIYPYPSPLHAVALQSPIFFQGGDPASGPQGPLETGSTHVQRKQTGTTETKTLKQPLYSAGTVQIKTGTLQNLRARHHESCEGQSVIPETSQREVPSSAQTTMTVPPQRDQNRHCTGYSRQQIPENRNQNLTTRVPQGPHRSSCPSTVRESSCDEVSSLRRSKGDQERGQSPEMRHEDHEESGLQARRVQRQRSGLNHNPRAGDTHTASPQFVHAKFVPAGSQKVKMRQADRKTRALKLRKPRTVRQQERTREPRSRGDQRRPGCGKPNQKYSNCQPENHSPGSGSDSSPCSSGLPYTNKTHNKPHPVPTVTRSGRVQRHHNLAHDLSVDLRRKRQVDLIQTSYVQHQWPRESQVQAPMVRCSRPSQWTGPSSESSTSFHQSLNSRYPPAPRYRSSLYPPRCESEYSAECASLFHSTVAASSEGELSDHTANRFGDSESSQSYQSYSESDSSLSLDQDDPEDQEDCLQDPRGMPWAQVGVQQLPHPGPSACRIKASRALKKKIRRFQPASLKIMTLV